MCTRYLEIGRPTNVVNRQCTIPVTKHLNTRGILPDIILSDGDSGMWFTTSSMPVISHESLNVPMGHITQPLGIWSTRWLLWLVMSNIPKMGELPTPDYPH